MGASTGPRPKGGTHSDAGTVFTITPGGAVTTLYSFCAKTKFARTATSPLRGAGSGHRRELLWNNIHMAGPTILGTVFRITPSGILTTIHRFDGTDGYDPYAGLVQGPDGNFYGTTYAGGPSNHCEYTGFKGCGTVFKITPSGTLTTLYNF